MFDLCISSSLVAGTLRASNSHNISEDFKTGDSVYTLDSANPWRLMRNGWGDYERKVRVAGLHEDTNRYGSGRWVRTDKCLKLEANDKLIATKEVTAATNDACIIPMSSTCRFLGWDTDGDFELMLHGAMIVCFKEDLDHFNIE